MCKHKDVEALKSFQLLARTVCSLISLWNLLLGSKGNKWAGSSRWGIQGSCSIYRNMPGRRGREGVRLMCYG